MKVTVNYINEDKPIGKHRSEAEDIKLTKKQKISIHKGIISSYKKELSKEAAVLDKRIKEFETKVKGIMRIIKKNEKAIIKLKG